MKPLFCKEDPIQPSEMVAYKTALRHTQGNILKSHGRKTTYNLFLHFAANVDGIKTAIRTLAKEVTSAWAQAEQTARFKDPAQRLESLFVGFGISSCGYKTLKYDVCSFSPAFVRGMANSDIGDHSSSTWEVPYQVAPDAMILLAHNDQKALACEMDRLTRMFSSLGTITHELGTAIYNGNEPAEHFGFVDGISQPLFFQSDIAPFSYWDPSAGTKLVLIKDPHGVSDDDCGSYYVFRKLAQNVAGFKTKEAQLQAELDRAGRIPNSQGRWWSDRHLPSRQVRYPAQTSVADTPAMTAVLPSGRSPNGQSMAEPRPRPEDRSAWMFFRR